MESGQSSRPQDCRGKFNIEGLQLHLESRIDGILALAKEQAKYYEDKFRSLDASTEKALAAVEKQTAAAFAANKEAVLKTEEAQKAYNAQHNDLTRKMEYQASQFVNREKLDDVVKQFDTHMKALQAAITILQQGDVAGGARREVTREHRQQSNVTSGHYLTIILAIVGWILVLLGLFLKTQKP